MFVAAILAAIVDFEKATRVASGHAGKILLTNLELFVQFH